MDARASMPARASVGRALSPKFTVHPAANAPGAAGERRKWKELFASLS